MDNSNLYISAQNVAAECDGQIEVKRIRLHFESLLNLARAGRELGDGIAVGSKPPDSPLWNSLRDIAQIKVEIYERGIETNTEQAIDQALQSHMYKTLALEEIPQIVVLMSGDGAGFARGEGFLKILQDMHNKGWGIELLAWKSPSGTSDSYSFCSICFSC